MNIITSSQNPVVKEVKSLKIRKHRDEKGLFFIEGTRFVEEALKEKAGICKIVITDAFHSNPANGELLNRIKSAGYETYILSDRLFREISDTENPQGILAVIRRKTYSLEDILSGSSFLLILDSLQDPGNLGTIIRTADAAGVDGVILSKGSVDLYNPKVLRSTMGSVFHVPALYADDLTKAIGIVKSAGFKVYAAHLKGKTSYFNVDLKKNIAVIIGNEANGIREEVAEQADMLVKIPMSGKAESLNASVAAGLLMYEVVRSRLKGDS
ncbi:23S rRNA (guanosine(2251)-2'-O)-methyltransferase RlmB [Clostridium thermosuccinogenes]|uniref:23S rRNA (guanosine(2251)-2'-O)-methyltransferase RlmB n=1 Tax=Clostridium thermosuccinogenes TaxID=84032 RepID=UPI000CCC206E|nr:23S rRNA (guanosine(2251)-2'-O)-methyltransferase RlmB [Pseudoclostridium thermosuccinogenes]PNT93528.1 23S rRNA (guanosine(2251)-2'-O)-methyltransferase RlmB [Pseudoclostridium thermosuccinogenes]